MDLWLPLADFFPITTSNTSKIKKSEIGAKLNMDETELCAFSLSPFLMPFLFLFYAFSQRERKREKGRVMVKMHGVSFHLKYVLTKRYITSYIVFKLELFVILKVSFDSIKYIRHNIKSRIHIIQGTESYKQQGPKIKVCVILSMKLMLCLGLYYMHFHTQYVLLLI